jgi:glycerol-3-phosphate dehydrogenase (NAD(P)+)
MGRITILGAGAMGAALTTPLTTNGHDVRLWGTELDTALLQKLHAGLPHPRLGVHVNSRVQFYEPENLEEALLHTDAVVLAITSDGVESILRRAVPYLRPGQPLMMVTKGFGLDAQGRVTLLPSLLSEVLPPRLRSSCPIIAVGGPCKANEVAAGWPTATVYGSEDAAAASMCQAFFQTPIYRILLTEDVIGLEVAAALKNVYAIALGMCNGLEQSSGHPWHNLKAAIFPQALVEMMKLTLALGGRGETVWGLAGAGDLEVTALSGRNRIFGERLGRGEGAGEALESMRRAEQIVEGVAACRLAVALIEQQAAHDRTHLDDYPLLQSLYTLLASEDEMTGTAQLVERLAQAVMPAIAPSPLAGEGLTSQRVFEEYVARLRRRNPWRANDAIPASRQAEERERMELQTTLNGVTMPVLVLWGLDARSKDELFSSVYHELLQRGWVRPSYLEAVKRREEQYPTGLDFGEFAVALPHIDIEHVIRSALVIALVKEPIAFQAMDNHEQALACQLAIFPVLASTGDQLAFLSAVTTALQHPGFYATIIEQTSPEAAAHLLDTMFRQAEVGTAQEGKESTAWQ